MYNDFHPGPARNIHPAFGKLTAFVNIERMALACTAAYEDNLDSMTEKMLRLQFNNGKIQRAIDMEWCLCGCDKSGKRL